jgi:hypothetical protein
MQEVYRIDHVERINNFSVGKLQVNGEQYYVASDLVRALDIPRGWINRRRVIQALVLEGSTAKKEDSHFKTFCGRTSPPCANPQ